jgi:hypothetical protein
MDNTTDSKFSLVDPINDYGDFMKNYLEKKKDKVSEEEKKKDKVSEEEKKKRMILLVLRKLISILILKSKNI